jgi:uncharacterized protein YbbC (DUF1343 family)
MVKTGLEILVSNQTWQNRFKGNIALLCHSASIDSRYVLAPIHIKKIFGNRFKKLFGPQHGFVTDVQDNMMESKDYIHPYFGVPVHSLYSHTRIPTDEMLEGIDHLFVDLQDVGTRVYTYISTLSLIMEKVQGRKIEIVVLDRPNPVGGNMIEGNVLEKEYKSFVGRHEIPQRHALTMGEYAKYVQQNFFPNVNLTVIQMDGWKREMFFKDTGLPWVNPSPNLPTMEGAITFIGTVLFEGTNISEGRGTTRSLEIIGHPKIEAFSIVDYLNSLPEIKSLAGFILRPQVFMPTFQKHAGIACGGLQIQLTDEQKFKSWTLSQLLCRELYHHLKGDFEFHTKPYEYEKEKLAIDLINGTKEVRLWVEKNGTLAELQKIEENGMKGYLSNREKCLLY